MRNYLNDQQWLRLLGIRRRLGEFSNLLFINPTRLDLRPINTLHAYDDTDMPSVLRRELHHFHKEGYLYSPSRKAFILIDRNQKLGILDLVRLSILFPPPFRDMAELLER